MKTIKLLLTASLAMAAEAAQAQSLPAPMFATPGVADMSSRAATTAWVRGQSYLSGITSGQVSGALGFAPQRAAVLNVLDYGAVADGVTDLGPALRAIAAKLGGSGVPNDILIPAGHYVLSSPVVFTGGAPVLRGQGFTAGPNPASGTWITISTPGFVPFTFSGVGARGATVRDLAIVQAQPAPAAGWQPTNYDYVFKALNALGEVTFDNLLFAGVTRGIYADNSGRLLIRNVVGQFYVAGVEIDDCYDIPRIEALHAWTYSTSSPYVTAWQEANLDTVILRRVDGIFIGDLFSYAARSALYLTSGVNGVTTKLYLKSLYADFVKYGVWIDGNGVTGQIAQATTQHQDAAAGGGATIAGGRGLYVTGNTAQLQIDAWRTNSVAGPVIDLESNNAHVVISDFWANAYGVTAGDGTAAVFAADSGTNAGNFVQVLGTPMLQGSAPLYLFNAGVNAGRLRMPSMNSVGKAVNEPRLYDNSAGNPVTVAAIGADSSIDLQLQAKSATGSVRLQANGQTVLRADDANGGTDDVLFRSGTGTMNLVAEGGDATVDYLLTPKGVGGGVRLQGNGLTTLRTDNPNAGDSDMLVRPGTAAVNLIVESASASADLVVAAKGPNGGVRLQAQGATVVRLDNPAPGTSDLLIRSGNQTVALTVEDPAANANLVLNPKGLGTVALGTSPNSADNSANVVTSAWVVGQRFLTTAPVGSVAGRTGAVTLGVADVSGAAPLASPSFSGTPSVPTATAGTSTTQAASTAFVAGAVAAVTAGMSSAGVSSVNARSGAVTLALSDIPGAAPLASPALSGVPTAPTATASDSSTTIASTAYVKSQGYLTSAPVVAVAGRTGVVSLAVADVSGAFAASSAGPLATQAGATPAAAALAALGFTPYNSTNPSAFVSSAGAASAAPVQSVAARTGAVTLAVADVSGAFPTAFAGPLATQAGATASAAALAALGFTPYNATNPAGYVASAAAAAAAPVQSVAGRTGAVVVALGDVAGAAPLASPTFSGTVTTPILAVTGSEPVSTVLAGPLAAAGAPSWRQLVAADVSGAFPSASAGPLATQAGATASAAALAALGFTPYNATNPGSYVNAAGAASAAPVQTVAGRGGTVVLAVGDVSGAAPLASPILTGTPSAPTAAAGTGTTQLATTAYVQGQGYQTATQAAAAAPVQSVAGRTGAVTLAVADVAGAFAASSVGPLATQAGATPSAAALAALGFTPYNATNPNGYVNAAGAAGAAPVASVAGRTGAVVVALGDVAGAAPLASPALTGTPSAPTATAGTNTAQLATTAYATTAVAAEATVARAAEAAKAPLASPTFSGTVTTPILAVTGSQPISTVLAGPLATAGAPTWRQLAVADVTGAAPLASPVFTGTPTIAPFFMGVSSGPLISFYGTLGGSGNYGLGTNPGEMTTYTGGSVGFRNSNNGGNAGSLFLSSSPAGTTIPGLLTAGGQSTVGTAPGGSGFARAGVYVLEASTTTAALSRMTTDGNVAGLTNCINLPNNSATSLYVDITGIDRTTPGNAARYRLLDVLLLRGASASTTAIANGVSAAAANGSMGSGNSAGFTAAADTTNGCLALSVTPPNADTWHWSARVVTTEVQ